MSEVNRDPVTPLERLSQGAPALLEDYLNDTVAPLQVAEPVLNFLHQEPEQASKIILRWADHQLNINLHAIPISDLLYHALKKFQIFEDLGLADAESLNGLVERTAGLVRSCCPRDELADFDAQLSRLHENSRLFRTVELLHRAGDEPAPEPLDNEDQDVDLDELRKRASSRRAEKRAFEEASEPGKAIASGEEPIQPARPEPAAAEGAGPLVSEQRRAAELISARQSQNPDLATIRQQQVALGLKRFSMLVDALEKTKDGQASAGWMPHLLSSAALGAQSYQEFHGYLARLKRLGLEDLHMEQVFRSLADAMPDWHLEGGTDGQPETAATVVMERVVEFSEHDTEKSERLQEIVRTAVEHFNRERLGAALTLFELADRLLKSSELAAFEQNRVRSSARAQLKMGPFRKLLKKREKQDELRRVLRFFPDLRVEALVQRLLKEEKRSNRHLIMELLRIHGREAREAVAEILISSTTLSGREWPWFFVRNLIRLLRDIPTDSVSMTEFELAAVVGYTNPIHSIQVVREAIAFLGTVQHPKAIEALVQRFHFYCGVVPKSRDGADADMSKIRLLSLSYLLRSENPHARSVALDTILAGSGWSQGSAQLLSVLGSVNLANDRSALDRIFRALRKHLGGRGLAGRIQSIRTRIPQQRWTDRLRGFGRVKEAALQAMIQALSGTPTPEVSRLLAEIERLRPTKRLADLARKTRESLEEQALEVDPDSEATLAGDLDMFGLPNIVQSLNQSEACGTLTIQAKEVNRIAVIRILFGEFVDAKAGNLRGPEALYLLMEKPRASTFRFVADNQRRMAKDPQELRALLFEGMRRRDEFERLRLLVPDQGVLVGSGVKPTIPAGERDTDFLRSLWSAITEDAATVEACEEQGLADPYRIRLLLLHWLEAGQLRLVEPGAAS